MRVLQAEVLGMCFGVRDALKTIRAIDRPETVTIHGELVHNEVVLIELGQRGFGMTREAERRTVPETPVVLITAHGVSDVERQRLQAAGKQLVDTTCPLVVRVHHAAQSLQQKGYHVLVIGRRGHVEVQGIVEDLHDCDVIQSVEEVRRYPHGRLGVVCQTTTPEATAALVHAAIVVHNPHAEVRFVDTICHPTKEHQRALERLLGQVDAMVVVGGRNSNNTRELVLRCREKGRPAFHVQGAVDLDPAWFAGCRTVGLTAGTSTLDQTVEEVRQALLQIEPDSPAPAKAI
jgi:4-hydroxy-3-methylbut-2-enyl diphosphate reductase